MIRAQTSSLLRSFFGLFFLATSACDSADLTTQSTDEGTIPDPSSPPVPMDSEHDTDSKRSSSRVKLIFSARPISNRYIVAFAPEPNEGKSGAPADAIGSKNPSMDRKRRNTEELLRSYPGKLVRSFTHTLSGFVLETDAETALRLSEDGRVAYVEQDGIAELTATQTNAPWALDRVDQRLLPLDGQFSSDTAGRGVHAYIIDSGIRVSHNEFEGRAEQAYSIVNDGRGGDDCYGHGTHIAGLLGGKTYGVAKAVSIHSVRAFDCYGMGADSEIVASIDWIVAHHQKPAIINTSLRVPASKAVNDAVKSAITAGITFVAAAGNDYGRDACQYSPASVLEVITVGATTKNDQRGDFSNLGPCVDVFAPGTNIVSAYTYSDASTLTLTGTSMAAPLVAGAAALLLEKDRAASPFEIASRLLASATVDAVAAAGEGSPNRMLFVGKTGP